MPVKPNYRKAKRQERLKRQAEFDAKYGNQRSSAPYQPQPLPSGGFGKGALK